MYSWKKNGEEKGEEADGGVFPTFQPCGFVLDVSVQAGILCVTVEMLFE